MANGFSILVSFIVVGAISLAGWLFSPRGENQTIWRSTVILSAWSCWLMWVITFLAQWHPLVAPERGDLRPEYNGGPTMARSF